MTWTCPCGATFGEDAFAFRAHLKSCSSKKVETEAQRDARELAEAQDAAESPSLSHTRYEKQLLDRGDVKGAVAATKRRDEWAARKRAKGVA